MPRSEFPLNLSIAIAESPLNAGLAAHPLQRQVDGEGTSLAEGPDALIVAPPGHAKLQAIVLIFDAKAISHRLPAVGDRQRIFALVSEVDDARAKDRPVAREFHARR